MPGADRGVPSPTLLHDVLADAREAGFLGPGPIAPQIRHAEGFALVAHRLAASGPPRPRLVDLGSGGGLPGLVVAAQWPEASVDLLEAGGRRAAFLERAVSRLGLGGRVHVLHERAEVCGRHSGHRGAYDGALARSFGRPAVVAECAAPLLKVGGWLVVSEPRAADARASPWPPRPSSTSGRRSADVRAATEGPTTGRWRGRSAGRPSWPSAPLPCSRSAAGWWSRNHRRRSGTRRGRPWPAGPLRQFGLEPLELVHEEFDYRTLRLAEPCPDRFPRRDGVPAKKPLF